MHGHTDRNIQEKKKWDRQTTSDPIKGAGPWGVSRQAQRGQGRKGYSEWHSPKSPENSRCVIGCNPQGNNQQGFFLSATVSAPLTHTKGTTMLHINTARFELEVSRTGAFLRFGRREFWLSSEQRTAPAPIVERVSAGEQTSWLYVGPLCLTASVAR